MSAIQREPNVRCYNCDKILTNRYGVGFCSRKCATTYWGAVRRRNRELSSCPVCGKEFLRYLPKSGTKFTAFCGYSCMGKSFENRNREFDFKISSYRAKASNLKSQAKLRKIHWGLSIEEACDLISKKCFYCSAEPLNPYNAMANRSRSQKDGEGLSADHVAKGAILYNGLDRVDSSRGYIQGNVVTCCTICNRAKNVLTPEEFYLWVSKIYSSLKETGRVP